MTPQASYHHSDGLSSDREVMTDSELDSDQVVITSQFCTNYNKIYTRREKYRLLVIYCVQPKEAHWHLHYLCSSN